jgi:hypothetical protein
MRRYKPIAPSAGTRWTPAVRAHIATHQPPCIGPLAGMPGPCLGGSELDHIRAAHGTSMKSESIATNGARLCGAHHLLKTNAGRTWRPVLIGLVMHLSRGCADCEAEFVKRGEGPVDDDCGHVDPVHGCPGPCQRRVVA